MQARSHNAKSVDFSPPGWRVRLENACSGRKDANAVDIVLVSSREE
jgi:hypothetical protein